MTPQDVKRHAGRIATLTLFVLLGAVKTALGQTFPMPIVGGGVLVSIEDGVSDGHYLSPGLSGTAPGWDWLVGVKVSRRMSLVFEASVANPFFKLQLGRCCSLDGRMRYERSHHDTMYSGLLHFDIAEQFKVVGGLSRISVSTDEEFFRVDRPTTDIHRYSHEELSTGVVFGFDYTPLRWKVLALGPVARVFIFDHHDAPGTHFGYGNVALRVGVRVQSRF